MTTYVETSTTQVTVQGGPRGPSGANGWTPQLEMIGDAGAFVLELADWTGGEGTKPSTGYFKPDGTLTADISQAAHFASAASLFLLQEFIF